MNNNNETTSNKGINVLSLFDGMSCGRIALERAGIEVNNYYSSEIDKHAIQVADKNYPQDTDKRLGNVLELDLDYLKTLNIDLLIGGSPCQGFSMAGKMKGSSTKCGKEVVTLEQYLELKNEGFEFDGQSYLFWEYIRVLKAIKPKYFLLENVRVTKKWLPMFNDALGVEPIMINSSLLSAQNRERFYWTDIPNIKQPEDKGLLFKDVLNNNYEMKPLTKWFFSEWGGKRKIDSLRTIEADKSFCITTNKSHSKNYYLSPCRTKARMLERDEVERLQTVPEGYTSCVSGSHAHKMLGNGWTVDVIAHIFNGLIKIEKEQEDE